jgi:hypothetical protein
MESFSSQVDLGPTIAMGKSKQSLSTGTSMVAVIPGELLLKKVTLYLSALTDEKLMNFVVGVENFFTGGRGDRTFERWTHFALEVTFEDGTKRILERTVDGVHFTAREISHDEVSTLSWESVPVVSAKDVFQFQEKERHRPYHPGEKNCKHLAYDFVAQLVLKKDLGDFFGWCGHPEAIWRQHQQ